jgi:hypothetical protein
MNATEFMQAHADNAVAGKIPDVMKDLTPDALAKVMGLMAGGPNPLTSNKVVVVTQEGDDHIFDVTYFGGDGKSVSMRERVRQIDGTWKIADLSAVP